MDSIQPQKTDLQDGELSDDLTDDNEQLRVRNHAATETANQRTGRDSQSEHKDKAARKHKWVATNCSSHARTHTYAPTLFTPCTLTHSLNSLRMHTHTHTLLTLCTPTHSLTHSLSLTHSVSLSHSLTHASTHTHTVHLVRAHTHTHTRSPPGGVGRDDVERALGEFARVESAHAPLPVHALDAVALQLRDARARHVPRERDLRDENTARHT